MRSTIAGLSALLVFAVLQALAKTFFTNALEAGGTGRDILSVIVLGGTFGTFFAVYLAYSRRRHRRSKGRRF